MVNIDELKDSFLNKFRNVDTYYMDGNIFIVRPITRLEWKTLQENAENTSEFEIEDMIVESCLLYPDNFIIGEAKAGLIPQLADNIIKSSGYESIESRSQILAYARQQVQTDFGQTTAIISEAFPSLTIEEIEKFDLFTTAKYVAHAEFKLQNLRGTINMDYAETPIQEIETPLPPQEPHAVQHTEEILPTENVEEGSTIGLTKEERLLKHINKRDVNKLEEMRRLHPDLVDNFNDFNSNADSCNTTPVSLRTPL